MTEKLIRLANLQALNRTARQLEADVGGQYTYWRDMLKGQKAFGEKIARKIEHKLGLPERWMDEPHGGREARDQAASYTSPNRPISDDDWLLLRGVKEMMAAEEQARYRHVGELAQNAQSAPSQVIPFAGSPARVSRGRQIGNPFKSGGIGNWQGTTKPTTKRGKRDKGGE